MHTEQAVRKFSPSKKRYDKDALDIHNARKRYNEGYSLNNAAHLRGIMNERIYWIKNGKTGHGFAFSSYFDWKKRYRLELRRAVACAFRLPLPG